MIPLKDSASQKKDLVNVFQKCSILPSHKQEVIHIVKTILLHKDIYEKLEKLTGVPWFVSSIIHELEASLNFKLGLHCGTRWDKVTTEVPKGRGPFKSWIDASVDSLEIEGLSKIGKDNWTLENVLYNILKFNGISCYIGAGMNSTPPMRSAYMFSYTDAYVCGKFVADGVWDPKAVSKQCGAAAILKEMSNEGLIKL